MKNKMQILGRISLGLLICIILGQGIWLYRVREMENHGFEQTLGRGLNDISVSYTHLDVYKRQEYDIGIGDECLVAEK